MKSTGTQSSNELQKFELTIQHQDSSPSNDRQSIGVCLWLIMVGCFQCCMVRGVQWRVPPSGLMTHNDSYCWDTAGSPKFPPACVQNKQKSRSWIEYLCHCSFSPIKFIYICMSCHLTVELSLPFIVMNIKNHWPQGMIPTKFTCSEMIENVDMIFLTR